jgi:hypothetical protein
MYIHLQPESYKLRIKDEEVSVLYTNPADGSIAEFLAYSPSYAVDPTTPKTQWDTW